jgi:peptidoglycan hydrolase-like protein with peptidoglycan-binding domain
MAKTVSKGKRKTQGKKSKSKTTAQTKSQGKKRGVKPAKVFIYALALAALGGGGYLVYDRVKRKKAVEQNQLPSDNNSDTIIINNTLPTSISSFTSKMLSSASDSFPLKRGSKGTRVTALQQALSKTTPSILIDGQFGPQTAAALKNAGYPEIVDETLFNKITGASKNTVQVVFNPSSLAMSLYGAAQSKNLSQVLSVLKQLKSVSEYSAVNEHYKKQGFISKTIVNDLLEYAFKSNEAAKVQIRNEFLRIGLKVSSTGTWSLQGLRLFKDLITIRETVVTDSRNNRIPVRRNTILGDELEVANGMTWFKSIDDSILNVPTQDVKYT